ncbi:NRDE-2, necessary for RNA interference-domain-containing protein [Dichomitus squalens]|uniref:NRDE-2, necessary for RNA interference-domain-containing protein n=1 Tax=Dichomitus squalens TaxID=114155 RepID=A0A4Q9N3P6_9APHY|nr:NRDE-2, necessary for RNA interference-domain-containing protein [Dichomitus squalens]
MSFPSFPSFASFPDLDPGPSSRASVPRDDKEEGKKHKKSRREGDGEDDAERKKRKHKQDKRREREDGERARHRNRSRSLSRKEHKDEGYGLRDDERTKLNEDHSYRREEAEKPNAKEGLVYFTDRKGDPLNVRYGGLHAGDIPKHRLVGGGKRVLGLSPALSVVHRGRGGIEIGPFGRRKIPALTDSSSRHLLAAPPKRRLLASLEDRYKFREVDGFIRVVSNKPRRDDQAYREIEREKQDLDSDESDVSEESASSGDESDTTFLTSLQSTLKALEERLATQPTDVSAWLSLLSHTLSTVPVTSKKASRARAEISLSVLRRAMSTHPGNLRSKVLRLKYMKAGEEIWEPEKLKAEWEDAVKVDNIEIWMAWLDWRVRKTSNILESIIEDVGRISRALATRGDEIGQLRVFWRAAVALRDAGYVERANAVFQAQAELLYTMPERLAGKPYEEQLDAMEEYWDSEVPRLGEPEAGGWAVWDTYRHEQLAQPPKPVEVPSGISDPYSKWAASEALADRTRAMSLRSTDEDDTADPYAIVLFSDIRPLLLPLRTPRVKNVFRRIWLAFLGLHVPGFLASLSEDPDDNADDRWAYSHLAGASYLSSVFPSETSTRRVTADAHAGVLIGREREFGSGFGPVKNWGYGTIGPLDTLGSSKWTMWSSEDVQGADAPLIREIFRQCRLEVDGADWDILNVAFEAAVNAKGAIKISKSLLASVPESLAHWAAHARLESLRGKLNDARKVYQTVLTSYQNRAGESTLWWDWARLEWLARNDDAALEVIVRSSGGTGSGGIAVLRAKRHLQTLLTQLATASWKEREAWIKLAALLELLTSSPQSALALFDSYLSALQPRSPAHESLTVASLALLYNHATVLKSATPPALLRERVEKAVEVYPNNTAILGIFLEAQKGQGIWGRVRALLGETAADGTGKEKSVARRVAEVWVAGWEKGRWEAEVERTRSGLAAAVEDDRTRGSAVLWKLFVAFEMRAGQPERAKRLLVRAVGECPLVKELYLLAFGPLRAVFSTRELNQWADTMAERGIRMRAGLDEVVGDLMDNKAEDAMSDVGDGEDEIEQRAKELRRLMPY